MYSSIKVATEGFGFVEETSRAAWQKAEALRDPACFGVEALSEPYTKYCDFIPCGNKFRVPSIYGKYN